MEYNAMEYSVVHDLYAELHFTEEQFIVAYENLKERGFIKATKDELDSNNIILKLTAAGRSEYEFQKKLNHDEFTRSVVERKVLIGQDKFQETVTKNSERQGEIMEVLLRLSPLVEESNTSAINTNIHTRQMNKILVVIFLITAAFAFACLVVSFLSYRMQQENRDTKTSVITDDSQNKIQTQILKSQSDTISHQAFIIDSLRRVATPPEPTSPY